MPKQKSNKKLKAYRHTTQYYRIIKKNSFREKNHINASCSHDFQSQITSSSLDIAIPKECEIGSKVEDDQDEFISLDPKESNIEFETLDDQLLLLDELRLWALQNKVTISAVSDLLKILRAHGKSELPQDGRTLLKTPATLEITQMGAGKFWYHGMAHSLENALLGILPLVGNKAVFYPFFSNNCHNFKIISRG